MRLSEYASLSKRRFHELRVGKDDGVSAQIVCACSDHAEQALLEKAETIVPYQQHEQDNDNVLRTRRHSRKISSTTNGRMSWLNDPHNSFGRGRIQQYASFVSESTPRVVIIPLTYKWTLSRIFGILRRAREKLVIVEVQKKVLMHLISSTDSTMVDELTVYKNTR